MEPQVETTPVSTNPPGTPPSPAAAHDRVEPIVLLLFGAIVFYSLLMIAVSKWSPNDGQTFQVLSSLLSGFAGALMMRIKGPAGTSSSTQQQQNGEKKVQQP